MKHIRITLLLLAAFAVAGIAFALWLGEVPAGRPDPRLWHNAFYVLFARNEPLGLAVVALFSLAALVVLSQQSKGREEREEKTRPHHLNPAWLAAGALAVFAIAAGGTHLVCHDFALTADEHMSEFQAKIFLRGRLTAEIPPEWRTAWWLVKPTFADYLPATHSWKSTYLPGYAAMRAIFLGVGLQSLLNPLLATITFVALFGTARNIWPEANRNAFAAVALLGTSSQFLVTAMTAYAMPAHLALNTVWLWLYSQPERRRFYLVPLLGVVAIGLHQPIVHALFAAPFLLRLVLQRRWRGTLWFGLVYLLGCIGWAAWRAHFLPPSANPGGVGSIFRILNPRMAIIQPMNLLLLIGWSSLAMPLLALLGLRRFFRLPALVQDAAISCVLTLGFYYFFYADQGHGWGYRYFHGVLSCLVLVSLAGWDSLQESVGTRAATRFFAAGAVASLLILLPLRCFQVESFVRPFARTAAVIHTIPAQLVAFDARDAWYSADLIRNDPFLAERPITVSLLAVTEPNAKLLSGMGSVRVLDRDALTRLGLATERFRDFEHDPFRLGRGEQ